MSFTQGSLGFFELNSRREPEVWHGAGKGRLPVGAGKGKLPVGAGRPAGEELGSVKPLGGIVEQNLAPKRSVHSNTGWENKTFLLVAKANVNSFENPWSIFIDSGTSSNNVRRCSIEKNRYYAEELQAQKGEIFAIRSAAGTLVTVPKVYVNLGVKVSILMVSKDV